MDQSLIDEFRWLVDTEAAALLRLAQDDFLAHTSPLKIAKNLRSSTSLTRAALVMEQAQLRIRAKQKFPLAEEMFFTCLLYTSPSPRDATLSRMPSSA